MTRRRRNAESVRAAGVRRLGAAAALLSLAMLAFTPATAVGQRGGGHDAQPRYSRPASRPNAARNPYRANRPYAARPDAGQDRGFQGRGYRQQAPTGAYGHGQFYRRQQPYGGPGENYGQGQQGYGRAGQYDAGRPAQSYARPAMPGARPYSYTGAFPPGHLGSWLNQHRNVPVQGQEQLLRNDPSFRQLPPSDQQRLMGQLQRVDRMPEQERERRLARGELIEHMSPQERMQLNQSSRQLMQLPAGRQALVKHAFQDLSSVPIDQRQTVLDSQRYQGLFTPQERGILGNLLRAEPYEPPR